MINDEDDKFVRKPGNFGVLSANGRLDKLLPIELLTSLFKLDEDSGMPVWKTNQERGILIHDTYSRFGGREFGTRIGSNGRRRGSLRGHTFNVEDLVWALYHGSWPKYRIEFIDGDVNNVRADNLRYMKKSDVRDHSNRIKKLQADPNTSKSGRPRKIKLAEWMIKELFEYVPGGILLWKRDPSESFVADPQEPGTEVETVKLANKLHIIPFENGYLFAHDVVFVLNHGRYPTQIAYDDMDPDNLDINNLVE